jgi:Tat protein secretion system quality control protein TatD with DNase activity
VPYVASELALVRKVPIDDIARSTTANFERLFGLSQYEN